MRPLPFRASRSFLAPLILLLGVSLTLMLSFLTHERVRLNAELRFQQTVDEIRSQIETRLQVYLTALRQARGLFHLKTQANRDSFRVLTEAVHPAAEYPGLTGIGFIENVAPDKWNSFIGQARRDYADARIEVWQAPGASKPRENWLVRFFEPETQSIDGHPAIGFRIDSDPTLSEALHRARDSGGAALSRALVVAFGSDQRPAFILALPIYFMNRPHDTIADRRATLRGFVFTSLAANDFFEGPISRSWLDSRQVHFSVYDDDLDENDARHETNPIYTHPLRPSPRALFATPPLRSAIKVQVQAATHPIWLEIESDADFISGLDRAVPWTILSAGMLLSFGLFFVLRSHARRSTQLSKSERQLRLVTDALPVLIGYIDSEEIFRFTSHAYETWYRIPQDAFRGRKFASVYSPLSYERLKPHVDRVLGGETVAFETEIEMPDQSLRPIHAHYVPDFAPSGHVKGFIALVSDIGDRRREEERGRFLVELSSVLAASLDIEPTLQRLASLLTPAIADWCTIDLLDDEDGMRRLASYTADQSKQLLLNELTKERLPNDPTHTPQIVAHGGEPLLLQDPLAEAFVARSGQNEAALRAVRLLGHRSAMFLPLKARNHVLGTLTLVSTRADRRFSNDDLVFALDIARRAALAIDNGRLYLEVSQANRSKDEFLATLSHELRTPMNVILGWLEVLSSETLDPETFTQVIATLNRNASIQMQLINDLLDVSRIVNGKLTLQMQQTDLANLIENAVEGFQPAARAKNISLEVDIFDAGRSIFGDPNRIHQILWNLLSNAIKFTPEGGSVNIRLETDDGNPVITIRDTGRGIEPRFLPFVFERFRQEDGRMNRSHGGLGLGLSIVRYLMELHGGQVEARSAGKGHGACFVLRFPRRPIVAATDPITRQAPESRSDDAAASIHGARVLLIEDSADARILVERTLVREGCLVRMAENAASGLRELHDHPPDVILSDLSLPDEDGLTLMRRWRAHEMSHAKHRIPAAAMTGFAQQEDALRAIESGFDLHVVKPVTATHLVDTVHELLRIGRESAFAENEPRLHSENFRSL